MATQKYSNQRSIKINKEKTDNINLYAKVNLNALETAMQVLSSNGFKIWMYLAKNQNGYCFNLSAVDLLLKCGLSDSTYRKCFKELCEKGYLIQKAGRKTHYDFYEMPQELSDNKFITIHKEE